MGNGPKVDGQKTSRPVAARVPVITEERRTREEIDPYMLMPIYQGPKGSSSFYDPGMTLVKPGVGPNELLKQPELYKKFADAQNLTGAQKEKFDNFVAEAAQLATERNTADVEFDKASNDVKKSYAKWSRTNQKFRDEITKSGPLMTALNDMWSKSGSDKLFSEWVVSTPTLPTTPPTNFLSFVANYPEVSYSTVSKLSMDIRNAAAERDADQKTLDAWTYGKNQAYKMFDRAALRLGKFMNDIVVKG